MLATLNARKMMRQISESTDGLSLSVEKAAQGICPKVTFYMSLYHLTELKSKVPTQIEINNHTVQEFHEDPCQMNIMVGPFISSYLYLLITLPVSASSNG